MATRKVARKQRVSDTAGPIEKVFLASLGAFANVQKFGSDTFDALVKDGEKLRKKTSKRAEKMIDDVEDSLRDVGDEVEKGAEDFVTTFRRRAGLDKFEKAFDKAVADTMDSLNVPSKNDIDKLNKKLNRILRVVDSKETRAPARKAPVARKKSAAREAAKPVTTATSKAA